MRAVGFILGDVVDNDGLTALPDDMAERGFEFELAAGLKPEGDAITHAAGDPAVLGHTCDCREAHTRGFTNDLKYRRQGLDIRDGANIRAEVDRHDSLVAQAPKPNG